MRALVRRYPVEAGLLAALVVSALATLAYALSP
jgi:hypothetical protein